MPFYEKGDTRIYYEEVGSGFPLLIIPGSGLNSTVAGLRTSGPFNPMETYKKWRPIKTTSAVSPPTCVTLLRGNPPAGSVCLRLVHMIASPPNPCTEGREDARGAHR